MGLVLRPRLQLATIPAASRPVRLLDDVLSSLPTAAEVAAIERDFALTFDFNPGGVAVAGASPFASAPSRLVRDMPTTARSSLVNALRCLRELTFDSPVPVVGAANIYDWLRRNNNAIHVFSTGEISHAGQPMKIRRSVVEGWWLRRWDDNGIGMVVLAALLVHEATHYVNRIPHDCGNDDSSLEYGGAWAGQFWFMRWLGEHSGGHLTGPQKLSALDRAGQLLRSGALSCGRVG